ncbi:DUF2188 domain-containing protein [Streptomyces sp. NPDC004288]
MPPWDHDPDGSPPGSSRFTVRGRQFPARPNAPGHRGFHSDWSSRCAALARRPRPVGRSWPSGERQPGTPGRTEVRPPAPRRATLRPNPRRTVSTPSAQEARTRTPGDAPLRTTDPGHSPARPFVAPCAAADPRLHGALGSRGTRSGPPPQTYAGRQRASTQQGVGLCSRCLGIHAQGKATGDHPAVLARALMPLRRSGTHVDRHTAGPRLRAAPSAQRLCVDRQRARRTIMATKRTVYHVAPSADRAAAAGLKWQVEGREGRRLLHEPHHTQREAIDSARRHAKAHLPAQVVVHARDGHVRTAYAYGEASEAPRGERGRRAGARGGIF